MYKKRDGFYFRFDDGTEKKLKGAVDIKTAITARDALIRSQSILGRGTVIKATDNKKWDSVFCCESFDGLPYWVTDLYKKTKSGAKKRGIGFHLTEDDFLWMVKNSRAKCSVSGLKFDTASYVRVDGSFTRRPYAPSIDRIDSHGEYTIDNVRLVCVAVNYAMNFWGEDVLLKIATGVCKTRSR